VYTVVRQTMAEGPPEEVWRHLTEPERLAQWFADCRAPLGPGAEFVFSFGDGDAFTGRVTGWQPPSRLELEWKFLGLGPRFDIAFVLGPAANGRTEVSVIDRGALTREELDSLREGWEDFLERLARFSRTGQGCRYDWSAAIGLGALLGDVGEGGPPELDDRAWWEAAFGGPRVELAERSNGRRTLRLSEPSWDGASTEAEVEIRRLPAGTYLGIVHSGWPSLPETSRLHERRRYAGLWRRALADLEDRYA